MQLLILSEHYVLSFPRIIHPLVLQESRTSLPEQSYMEKPSSFSAPLNRVDISAKL